MQDPLRILEGSLLLHALRPVACPSAPHARALRKTACARAVPRVELQRTQGAHAVRVHAGGGADGCGAEAAPRAGAHRLARCGHADCHLQRASKARGCTCARRLRQRLEPRGQHQRRPRCLVACAARRWLCRSGLLAPYAPCVVKAAPARLSPAPQHHASARRTSVPRVRSHTRSPPSSRRCMCCPCAGGLA